MGEILFTLNPEAVKRINKTARTVSYNRKRLARNTAKGLCGCGRSEPVDGYTKCQICRDSIKNADRLHRYGITTSQYEYILEAQSNRCAICSVLFSNESKNTKPHIDHDHESNKVRGLLCGYCNQSLGGFKESTTNLLNAISYLMHYEQKEESIMNKESINGSN